MEQQIDYLTQAQRVVNMILEIELPQLGNVDIECLNGTFIFSFLLITDDNIVTSGKNSKISLSFSDY